MEQNKKITDYTDSGLDFGEGRSIYTDRFFVYCKPNTHGGSRPNSGRPKLGKKKYLISSLPEHIEEIKAFIKELHKPAN